MFQNLGSYKRWEGCKLWYIPYSLRLWDNTHNLEFIDCDRAYGESGFSIQDKSPYGVGTPHDITIRGCYIHDIGVYKQNVDAEGIGVNGGDDITIESNEFYNCGSAYTCYPYNGQTNKNHIIRWNYIHDSHQLGGARGRGIELNTDYPASGERSGCQVYGNIVTDLPGVAYRSTWPTFQLVFYDNVAYNCDYSFYVNYTYSQEVGPNVVFKNNISVSPTTAHIYFGSNTAVGNYTIDSDNNLFCSDGDNLFIFKQLSWSTATNFSGWQALSKSGCTFDPNSIVADLSFVDPKSGSFNFNPGSLAIASGVDVGLIQDYDGNLIPIGSLLDVGSYEAVIDPNNPPTVLQANGNKSEDEVDEIATLTSDTNDTESDSKPISNLVQNPLNERGDEPVLPLENINYPSKDNHLFFHTHRSIRRRHRGEGSLDSDVGIVGWLRRLRIL
jgi:hypothetical protein